MPLKIRVMEISYERKHNDSYMIIDGEVDSSIYEVRMINDNDISALLKFTTFALDGREKYSYNISRKENLEDFVESQDFTIDVLERIVINIQLALDELGKYLIDEEYIWLSKESIFLEKSNENFKVGLCFYPKKFGSVQIQFRELMEYFITVITKDDRDGARLVYEAYDLTLKDDYTLEEIIDCLQMREEIMEEQEEIYVEHISMDDDSDVVYEATEAEYISDIYEDEPKKVGFIERLIGRGVEGFSRRKQRKEESAEEFEDFVIDPDYELEEKTVLLTESKAVGKLIYDGNSNEDDFIINKDIFRIGSSKNNDAILHAKTVSGSHAKIVKEGDDYYLTDTNSLNGSFVNSMPLPYRKPYLLKPMDIIRFASESYVFM